MFQEMHDVAEERANQDVQWGVIAEREHLNHDVWTRVLGEEFGEVCMALNDESSLDDLYWELTQVAAVAMAWMEWINIHERQR